MKEIKVLAVEAAQNLLIDLKKFKMSYADIGMFADQIRVELRKGRCQKKIK